MPPWPSSPPTTKPRSKRSTASCGSQEGPDYDDRLDTDDFEIIDEPGPHPARIYRFGTHYLKLHPEGVVEGTLENGLIYWRSITRAGEVMNMRVEPQTRGPQN